MKSQNLSKKPTNLSLEQGLLNEAKELGINLSKAAETGLRRAVSKAKSEAWRKENAKALQSSCDWIDQHGLPLDEHRQF